MSRVARVPETIVDSNGMTYVLMTTGFRNNELRLMEKMKRETESNGYVVIVKEWHRQKYLYRTGEWQSLEETGIINAPVIKGLGRHDNYRLRPFQRKKLKRNDASTNT